MTVFEDDLVSALASSFFCLETKETKIQDLQNTPARILQKVKCGRMISDHDSLFNFFQSSTELSGLTSPFVRIHLSRFDGRRAFN